VEQAGVQPAVGVPAPWTRRDSLEPRLEPGQEQPAERVAAG
jgi:hypothetical protein